MYYTVFEKFKNIILILVLTLLVACGGGGYHDHPWVSTKEYYNNYGLAAIKAEFAYLQNATGDGVVVAVIDSGIDVNHDEFLGRIHKASTDVDGGKVDDDTGHGTWVAGVIAAGYGSGKVQGVAYNSQIMAIDAYTKNRGVFFDDDLIKAIDHAIANGADIINMSLGGPYSNPDEHNALKRAAKAGIIIVASTGNDASPDPGYPARYANDPDLNGLMVGVGSVDRDGNRSSFSNGCSTITKYCLVAPGGNIYTTDIGGGYRYVNGTSFSAPHVSGAMALMLDLFPNLKPQEVVKLILSTAVDSDGGSDFNKITTWEGNGVLNLENALKPQGTMTFFKGDLTTSIVGSNLKLSAAFGDSLHNNDKLLKIASYDSYNREYAINLNNMLSNTDYTLSITPFMDRVKYDRKAYETSEFSMALNYSTRQDTSQGIGDFKDIVDFQSFHYSKNLPSGQVLSFSSVGAPKALTLSARDVDTKLPLALTGHNGIMPYSFLMSQAMSLGLSSSVGKWDVNYGLSVSDRDAQGVAAFGVSAKRAFENGLSLGLNISSVFEDNSFLGAKGTGHLGKGYNAHSMMGGLNIQYSNGNSNFYGAYSMGNTSVSAPDQTLFKNFSTLQTESLAIGYTYKGLWTSTDSFGIQVAKPLRLISGSVEADVIQAGADGKTIGRLDLSPSGSQTNIELGYSRVMSDKADIKLGLAVVMDAGHRANVPTEYAAGFVYNLEF